MSIKRIKSPTVQFTFRQDMNDRLRQTLSLETSLRREPLAYILLDMWWPTDSRPSLKRLGPISSVTLLNHKSVRIDAKRVLVASCVNFTSPRYHKKTENWYDKQFYMKAENSRHGTPSTYKYLWWNDHCPRNQERQYMLIFGNELLKYAFSGKLITDYNAMFHDNANHLYFDSTYVHLLTTVRADGTPKPSFGASLSTCHIGLTRYTHDEFIELCSYVPSNVRRRAA